ETGDGTRTRNLRSKKEPLPAQQAESTVKVHDNCRGIDWLRGQGSNLELLLQGQAWFRFHHLAKVNPLVWTERLQLPTPGFRRRRASIAPRPVGTDGGSRTRTDGGLSAVPLPVGLRQRASCHFGGPCATRTRNLLLAGELRFRFAPPALV